MRRTSRNGTCIGLANRDYAYRTTDQFYIAGSAHAQSINFNRCGHARINDIASPD